ncbi:MAG: alpha/beta fold hydrolase [Candidatus Lokiarchaeota archaeon]|nr:alpha/beta fold hydrolase [Candidatus Lokiarchaeota archaeon]MBD3199176.1 alpha/beta fold hydrolase [Candidatus Lokiarchaeota archaeon]
MKHKESNFKSDDDLTIYFQYWLPEDEPVAIIQVVHGFAEHSGRYLNVVNKLVPLGYGLYADDHRGHGKSEGTTNYVDSFEQFIDDQKRFNDIIKKNHPDLPNFMLGHSMGSGIATYFAEKYEQSLNGLILSGTGNKLGEELSGFVKFMSKVLAKLRPKMKIDPKLDPQFLSHDSKVVDAYINDPLVHHEEVTTRLGYVMLKKFENIGKILEKLTLPILIQSGSEDQAVKGVKTIIEDLTMEDKTVKIYDGLYHEVYNEVKDEREKVLDDLAKWLERHK